MIYLILWHVAPFCWNYIFSKFILSNSSYKFFNLSSNGGLNKWNTEIKNSTNYSKSLYETFVIFVVYFNNNNMLTICRTIRIWKSWRFSNFPLEPCLPPRNNIIEIAKIIPSIKKNLTFRW